MMEIAAYKIVLSRHTKNSPLRMVYSLMLVSLVVNFVWSVGVYLNVIVANLGKLCIWVSVILVVVIYRLIRGIFIWIL